MANKTLFGALINSGGNILTILAGLLSFPIFTRLLSASDYGLMSLLSTTIYLSIGFGKLGIQQALVRLWKIEDKSNHVTFSTAFYGVLMISCAVIGVVLLCLSVYMAKIRDENVLILALIAGIILFESLKSILINKELVLERPASYNIAKILHKYLSIIITIVLLTTLNNGVDDVFCGFYAASVIVFTWLYVSDKKIRPSFKFFDAKLFKEMMVFGFPLLIVELIDQVLSFSDRYFIAYFLDVVAVGQYSAAYNFIFNIQSVVISTFSLTIAPIVVRKYNTDGDAGVHAFLDNSIKYYCCIGSAVALGLFSVGPDVFILLASSRYEQAEPLVKPIVAGYFFYGIYTIAAYKLFIHKRTVLAAIFMTTAAAVSVAANIILLPKIGVMGAAISTFLAYGVLFIIGLLLMWRMRFVINILTLIPYILPSMIMYGVILMLPTSREWISVGFRISIGSIVWIVIAILFFKQFRNALTANIKNRLVR
jgi:O-antigen/teichoic acid export membrane protein